MNTWNVYLDGKHIDTVYMTPSMDKDEVERSLIMHDSYHPNIRVKRAPLMSGQITISFQGRHDPTKFQYFVSGTKSRILEMLADSDVAFTMNVDVYENNR